MEHNLVGWFEIPVTDMDRAKKFYEEVFNIEVNVQDFGGLLMGWFPFAEDKPGASGSLVKHEESYQPSDTKGVLVYFASTDLAVELERVVKAGGRVIQEKTQISEDIGYMGLFIDSEGNRIALHSRE
ncbi:VOC family protein [Leptobacterium flavescens]|uniref:VOC family protein n=1 Tax=Leptobacterium flavescens TaxID=472055 RepID=A0A6P0UH52_9FLAO|nr:VOC family protein [Leptobacterium flavescens]NER11962.1 VOC family protein [Leptobacterium flavescens]